MELGGLRRRYMQRTTVTKSLECDMNMEVSKNNSQICNLGDMGQRLTRGTEGAKVVDDEEPLSGLLCN